MSLSMCGIISLIKLIGFDIEIVIFVMSEIRKSKVFFSFFGFILIVKFFFLLSIKIFIFFVNSKEYSIKI